MKHRRAGFLLLPVSLLLAVIGALSYALVQNIAGASRPTAREAERARLVAEAGLAHAAWKLNQLTACSGYANVAASLGNDNYQVTVSPAAGSPVTLTATATLASGLGGSSATVTRQVSKTSGAQLTYTLKTDTAGGDTYLDATNPTKSYGGASPIPLQQGSAYPLLRFDLSSLPAGSRIVDAKLQLYRESAGSLNLSMRNVDAYRVLESWLPGTKSGSNGNDGANWQTRDNTVAWQSAGGSVETVSALDFPHTHFYLWAGNWMEWSIANLVQGWVDGRYPNHGLMLRATTGFNGETYSTAESPDSTRVPKLIVKYVAPCGAVNPPSDGIAGRVAWWKLDEGSGATAADAIAAHSGSLTGGSWSASGGVSGGALAFAAVGKVTVAHAADLSQTGDFSLAAWINMSATSGRRPVLYKGGSSTESNYTMGTRNGELYFEYYANGAWRTYSTSGLNLRIGTWYHISATYKASTREIKLYLDGAPVGSFTANSGNTPVANNKALLIGSNSTGEGFLGRLDDVQIVASTLDIPGVATIMGGSVRRPVADAYIFNGSSLNYGASTPLIAESTPNLHPLVRFDLSGIPVGTVVKRAILSFHVESAIIVGPELSIGLYPLKESWVEGTQSGAISTSGVTWTKRQVGPDLAWTTPGGTYASPAAGILTLSFGAATQRYWEVDITPTVQEWVDGVRANNGLLLEMAAGGDVALVSSRESLHLEPRLVIGTQ